MPARETVMEVVQRGQEGDVVFENFIRCFANWILSGYTSTIIYKG